MALQQIPRSTPEATGVSREALETLIKNLDRLHGIHSLFVLRHGKVVAEVNWAPYQPQQAHLMFSVTKTFMALAIGCLIAEGNLSIDAKVIDLLPDAAPARPSRKLQKMQIKHLLTMSTGHVTEPKVGRANWAKAILKHPVKVEPGSHFMYNSMASHLLSVVLTKITGQTALDYLMPRLFEPLGISFAGADAASWPQDPDGNSLGGWGLSLKPEDLAKLGQLLLQKGNWRGHQLVPAQWVDAMMAAQVDSSPQGWGPNSAAGYGYQMWRCTVDAARADGAFGQFAIVWPQHDAVITTTSGMPHSGAMNNLAVLDVIFNAMAGAFGAPSSDAGSTLVETLSLPLPDGAATSPLLEKINGVKYQIAGTTDTVTVRRVGEVLEVAYSHKPAVTHQATHGGWNHYPATGPDGAPAPAAAAYAWTNPHTLVLQIYAAATPFGWRHTLTWNDAATELNVKVDQNVSFGTETVVLDAQASRLVGKSKR